MIELHELCYHVKVFALPKLKKLIIWLDRDICNMILGLLVRFGWGNENEVVASSLDAWM